MDHGTLAEQYLLMSAQSQAVVGLMCGQKKQIFFSYVCSRNPPSCDHFSCHGDWDFVAGE